MEPKARLRASATRYGEIREAAPLRLMRATRCSTPRGRADSIVRGFRPEARARLRAPLVHQPVGALVQGVPGMAAHPMPAHAVSRHGRLEPLPEIDVLDRLLVGGAPAVALPLFDPRHDAVAQLLAVGVDVD